MNTLRLVAGGLWLALQAGMTAPVSAQGLPDATTTAQCLTLIGGNSTNVVDPRSCSVAGASAALALSPAVTLSVTAAYNLPDVSTSLQGDASVVYYFEVVGGTPGAAVPIQVDTELATEANDLGTSSASFFLHASATRFDQDIEACSGKTCPDHEPSSFSATISALALSGDASNFIRLYVIAGVGDGTGQGTATALIDPFIYVDPSFADAASYSIVLSAEVGNVPVVPAPVDEPETVSLLLGGLGVILVFVRKRPQQGRAQRNSHGQRIPSQIGPG